MAVPLAIAEAIRESNAIEDILDDKKSILSSMATGGLAGCFTTGNSLKEGRT